MEKPELSDLSVHLLKKTFDEVKGSLPLSKICFGENYSTAGINNKTWEIEINPSFIYGLLNKGLDEEEAYKGILAHEIGHYKHHPFDLETNLMEIDSLEKNKIPLGIKNFYDDFICNSRIILERKDEFLGKMYNSFESEGILRILNLFYNMLSEKYGTNAGFSKKECIPEEWILAEKLNQKINIKCKKELHPYFIKEFYEVFKEQEIPDKSLQEIMKELKDSHGEKELKETIKELEKNGKISKESSREYLRNIDGDFSNFDMHVWESEKYSISVQKLKRVGSKFGVPFSPIKTSIDDIANYDPFISLASGGKAMPGLSNNWMNKNTAFMEECSALNDLILIIDSSGSMINPQKRISPAIVSAMTISNYYLVNNKKVGVVNFSSTNLVQDFSRNKSEIFSKLFEYQGGGTTLNIEDIALDFDSKDVLMITDEEISNYDEAVNFLMGKKSENSHACIISIGGNDSSIEENGVKRIKISHPKDIPKIVIGEES
ncbi:MAG: hypothetical protein PHT91_00245 [Candidatus Nanoarchaeia archaeon]|nr:hypothetical protein [Candidatus Nanoarchaeia archaeon]